MKMFATFVRFNIKRLFIEWRDPNQAPFEVNGIIGDIGALLGYLVARNRECSHFGATPPPQ
jgi:hypothetical protein